MADTLADTAANTASKYQAIIAQYATDVGMKILAAIIFWVVGRWLINFAVRMVEASLSRQKVDPTVLRYVGSIITVTLNVLLVIGILGYFGIQTTTFAALIAAAGVAIGMAWSGLLSNFAAGAFLIVLRPFKVGDFVTAGGVTGTVKEIGLFATSLNTPDNVVTIVGNGKIFADTIQNYTANPFRRVELKAQLAGNADHCAAMALLKEKVAAIPNVLADPAVDVEILEFNLVGPVLAVRPYTHNDNYWQVYFDTNRTIKEALAEAGFPVPTPSQALTITTPGQLAGLAAVAQSTTTPTSVN
jgi:small conductance mechanosensitive channel